MHFFPQCFWRMADGVLSIRDWWFFLCMHLFPHRVWRKADGFWSIGFDGFIYGCIFSSTVSDAWWTVV
jgi:hypothetical protein